MRLRNYILTSLSLLILVGITGCGRLQNRLERCGWYGEGEAPIPVAVDPRNQRLYVNPQMAGVRPNRVVFVASGRSEGNYTTHRKFLDEIASQFRAAGQFDVLVPPGLHFYGHSDNILQGKFSEDELAKIAREYNADTIALVKVNDFRSTIPMRVSASIALIDTNESVVLTGMDGIWDLANAGTENAFRQNVSQSAAWQGHEQELQLQSPVALFRFAAMQCVEKFQNSY